ncbi:MAG TPA: PmoA family protein [Bryobacteraceae bacterium]|nr:PmoA family protein [Bryobacteraceae bacterium]
MQKLLALAAVAALPLAAQVRITQGQNKIDVAIDGKPYTTFFYGPDVAKPYLSPLRAPSGVIVTRAFPMEKVAGESTDHQHHRSVWFAHSDVNGFDYWNNEFSYEKNPKLKGTLGHIFVTKVTKVESGAKTGEIDESSEWKQPDGTAVLNEDRKMIFHAGGPNRVIDFDFVLTAKTNVKFGDAKDGVFGIRLASGLEEPSPKSLPEPKRTGMMVNAQGCKTEAECWGKRSEWMDYSGIVDGQKVGVAIFDTPGNKGFPTYWHARGYGLFANNIFGRHEFTKGAEPDGSVTLKPGEKLHFRYRVVIHPGDTESAHIADLYQQYAAKK